MTRRTGTPSRRTGPPSRRTGPPSRRTGPPSRRTGPPSRRTGPPSHRTGPLSLRTGPPARRTDSCHCVTLHHSCLNSCCSSQRAYVTATPEASEDDSTVATVRAVWNLAQQSATVAMGISWLAGRTITEICLKETKVLRKPNVRIRKSGSLNHWFIPPSGRGSELWGGGRGVGVPLLLPLPPKYRRGCVSAPLLSFYSVVATTGC